MTSRQSHQLRTTKKLTIHIVRMRFTVVVRHRQHVTLRVRLGRRPVAVVGSITLNKGCWNAALLIGSCENLAVPSIVLCESCQQVVVSEERD